MYLANALTLLYRLTIELCLLDCKVPGIAAPIMPLFDSALEVLKVECRSCALWSALGAVLPPPAGAANWQCAVGESGLRAV
jgi:hypothetical protein